MLTLVGTTTMSPDSAFQMMAEAATTDWNHQARRQPPQIWVHQAPNRNFRESDPNEKDMAGRQSQGKNVVTMHDAPLKLE
ncbi:hypothetical protein L1987_05564 [Smallanthus sonchifolius]|uniref:Uncharacterized protein n=1 Tax=Smallanthus sonchifolius TaxID=185202 RepID=A0ACB9JVP4_9ASTR|nr:hypothetical protein L1987_05564 [Smallanthus sonchifolius]